MTSSTMLGARTCEPSVREEVMAATVRESEVWEGRCVGAWARTVSKSRVHVGLAMDKMVQRGRTGFGGVEEFLF